MYSKLKNIRIYVRSNDFIKYRINEIKIKFHEYKLIICLAKGYIPWHCNKTNNGNSRIIQIQRYSANEFRIITTKLKV